MPVSGKTKRSSQKIPYAVAGLGYIAQAAVLPAFSHAKKNSELTALISDDPQKLRELGKRYSVQGLYSYDQYEEGLKKEEIDAVYIALPNHLHCEYTVRAAKAGVHVLCEKPMALSVHECQSMIRAADKHGVKLMIAYRLHFEEANLRAIHLVQSGKIGEPRYFESAFSLPVKQKENIRLLEETGGGTLWDIGVYCINAARNLFQAEPKEVFATTTGPGTGRFQEVEETSAAILQFPDHRLATFTCSFGASDVSEFRIVGTKGQLVLKSAYEYTEPITILLTVNGKERKQVFPKRDQFAALLLHFSGCLRAKKAPEPGGDEGLYDVRVVEALYRSAEKHQPIELPERERQRRPVLQQSIRRPPVKLPALVHAKGPSG